MNDREKLIDLIENHIDPPEQRRDELIEDIFAAGFHSHPQPKPGARLDDSPTWITEPARRVVLTQGESLTLTGPAVVLHLPVTVPTEEAGRG